MDHLEPEGLARLLVLEALELAAEVLPAASADVEAVAADLEGTDSVVAVAGVVVDLAVVAEEEVLVVDAAESATSRTATVPQMAHLPVLAVHVRVVMEADVVATVIATVTEEAIVDQAAVTETTDEEEEEVVVVGMTEGLAEQTTNPWAAEIDRAMVSGTVGMVGMTARESVDTKATATTIHDSEGGIRAHPAAQVCFGKGLSRLPPFLSTQHFSFMRVRHLTRLMTLGTQMPDRLERVSDVFYRNGSTRHTISLTYPRTLEHLLFSAVDRVKVQRNALLIAQSLLLDYWC